MRCSLEDVSGSRLVRMVNLLASRIASSKRAVSVYSRNLSTWSPHCRCQRHSTQRSTCAVVSLEGKVSLHDESACLGARTLWGLGKTVMMIRLLNDVRFLDRGTKNVLV